MTQSVVVYVDIGGIQEYIFGSNRLRENIGASYVVKVASTTWVEATQPQGDIIFTGGGKACLIFPSRDGAKAWTHAYTKKVLQDAPGLRVSVGHSQPFDADGSATTLADALTQAQTHARQSASHYAPFSPTLGLGVTVPCRSTSLVANIQARELNKDYIIPDDLQVSDYPISSEIAAKIRNGSRPKKSDNDAASTDLYKNMDKLGEVSQHYRIPRDFDDFGRVTGSYSYLAVVHADGNGIGALFAKLHQAGLTNHDYRATYGALSELVNTLGAHAMNATVEYATKLLKDRGFLDVVTYLDREARTERPFFPLRPLVYGGDDMTFVCDARLAFALTPYLLQQFEQQSQLLLADFVKRHRVPDLPTKFTACAGVTIFKTHYPFARAYAMCEDLCQSAKNFSAEIANKTVSAFDWQIAPSGRVYDLDTLRRHEYHSNTPESLTIRPVILPQHDDTWRTWANITQGLDGFAKEWRERRNKLIAFQDVMRHGKEKTHQWLRNLETGLTLPDYVRAKRQENGNLAAWSTDRWRNPDDKIHDNERHFALYFDVIEILEHYRTPEQEVV